MLVVEDNQVAYNWHVGDSVTPLNYFGEVVIVFDPSKSNTAVLISTPEKLALADFRYNRPKTVLKALEFSGNNRKRGPVEDTTVFCHEIRQFLTELLSNVRLYVVAIEQAITKKGAKENHYTNMTLTEIRANLLNYFLEKYNVHVTEINNWAWKFAVLPDGFRGKFEKGSKKLFVQCFPTSPFTSYFEADMTDCVCILIYVLNNLCNNYTVFCTTAEPKLAEYTFLYTYANRTGLDSIPCVTCNPQFTLEENLNYYTNRMMGTYRMLVDADFLRLEDIYGRSGTFPWSHISDTKVQVIACRA